MKALQRAVLVAGLCFSAMSAYAIQYQFSYEFNSSATEVSGFFDGTDHGSYVGEIKDLTVYVNGSQLGGPFDVWRFAFGSWYLGGNIYFDVSQNGFMLYSGDGKYFQLIPALNVSYDAALADGSEVVYDSNPGTWSLRPVPEGGSAMVLLGAAFTLLATGARRVRE